MPQQAPRVTATNVIAIICIAVFAVQNLAPYGIALMIDAQALSTAVFFTGAWHTLLTSMFMHGDLLHLLCNMVTLYWVGNELERAYGPVKFLILYFICGIVGGLAFVWFNVLLGSPASVVGASGAIFGLFGAYVYLLARESRKPVVFVSAPSRNDVVSLLALIGFNVLFGFTPGIAWEAHFGGLASGVVAGIVLYALQKRAVRAFLSERNAAVQEYLAQQRNSKD